MIFRTVHHFRRTLPPQLSPCTLPSVSPPDSPHPAPSPAALALWVCLSWMLEPYGTGPSVTGSSRRPAPEVRPQCRWSASFFHGTGHALFTHPFAHGRWIVFASGHGDVAAHGEAQVSARTHVLISRGRTPRAGAPGSWRLRAQPLEGRPDRFPESRHHFFTPPVSRFLPQFPLLASGDGGTGGGTRPLLGVEALPLPFPGLVDYRQGLLSGVVSGVAGCEDRAVPERGAGPASPRGPGRSARLGM